MFWSNIYAMMSRRAVLNTVIAFLFVDALIISYYQICKTPFDLDLTKNAFLSRSGFRQKVGKLFVDVESQKERFWRVQKDSDHSNVEIPLHKVLIEEGSHGPADLFYDPRYTMSVYMHELQQVVKQEPGVPTLPFHWVDWVDSTFFNGETGFHAKRDTSCSRLGLRIRGRPNISQFCRNRDDISDEELESLGFRNRDSLPSAVITGHCPHGNPSFNDVRVFMAKSYTMAHLPKPYKVIILNDGENGGTYEFRVNQTRSSDQRLLFSDMNRRFLGNTPKHSRDESSGNTIIINAEAAYQELRLSVPPRFLRADEDIMGMYSKVTSDPGADKSLSLEEQHFEYPEARVHEQIQDYQKLQFKSCVDQAYLDGLERSLLYDGTNEPEYFKMALLNIRERKNSKNDWGWHYDWRFFNDALFYEKDGWTKGERVERTSIILERLLRNWNRFAQAKGIVSWIMHGPLLSWYWNGLMFPYDVDIDVQMPVSELIRLAKEYNQTLVVEPPSEGYGKYLIDVGTFIHNRERSDTGNHIDARFVDVDSGVYIDITGLAKSSTNLPDEYKENPIVVKPDDSPAAEVYNDRRKHFYTLQQLQPLRYSMLNGVPVYVPSQISDRLKWEYSRGLEMSEFYDWYFVPKLQLWVTKEKLVKIFDESEYQNEEHVDDIEKLVSRIGAMTDADGLRLLEDDETLADYYLTSRFTEWHTFEKSVLFTNEGKDNDTALADPDKRELYNNLVGKIRFSAPLRKSLFDYEAFDRVAHH